MIEVIKNKGSNEKVFPYIVRINEVSKYFTKEALEELQKKINLILIK